MHVHDKGQFLNDVRGIHGISYMTIASNYDKNGTSLNRYETQIVYLHKVTSIDKEGRRCNNNEHDDPKVTCIWRKIQELLGCSISWLNIPDISLKQCTTEEQFQNLKNFTDIVSYEDDKSVLKLTGCLPHCKRHEYIFKTMESLTINNGDTHNKESIYILRCALIKCSVQYRLK